VNFPPFLGGVRPEVTCSSSVAFIIEESTLNVWITQQQKHPNFTKTEM
jgi:hypothetical protein